jgi:hypothetical protein
MAKIIPFPQRKIHYIDVGEMSRPEAKAVLENMMQELRNAEPIESDYCAAPKTYLVGWGLNIIFLFGIFFLFMELIQ